MRYATRFLISLSMLLSFSLISVFSRSDAQVNRHVTYKPRYYRDGKWNYDPPKGLRKLTAEELRRILPGHSAQWVDPGNFGRKENFKTNGGWGVSTSAFVPTDLVGRYEILDNGRICTIVTENPISKIPQCYEYLVDSKARFYVIPDRNTHFISQILISSVENKQRK